VKELKAAEKLEYGLHLPLYEMTNRTWYDWQIDLPNPTPPPIEEPESQNPEPEA